MRITGTHIYGMLKCPHAVVLDLTEDRAKRRPTTELEEFVRKRGRDFEDEFVATLDGFVEPEYERGQWDEAAAQTAAFLSEGVAGVSQGVLLGENRLGIPDLLRKEPGASALGDFHYVVGDVKTSGRPRSDQLLQVAFYSRMLTSLQDRAPEYGYLVLKDGREEQFVLRDYDAALDDVEERVFALGRGERASEPFYSRACHHCHWSEVCVPALREANDVSLVAGMTRGLRATLARAEVHDIAALSAMKVDRVAKRTHLEPALLRRLKKAAHAHASAAPMQQARGKSFPGEVAVLHHLYDAFSERMLFFGVQFPATAGGDFYGECPESRDAERDAFLRVVDHVPERMPLLHYGEALPRWFAESAPTENRRGVEGRFVDLGRRLRGAAIYQGPVFGLPSHVEFALGVDPHRRGMGDAAAMHTGDAEWLMAKGRSDLEDLCGLVAFVQREVAADDEVDASTLEHEEGAA